MPTYDYFCPKCDHEQEVTHGMFEEPEVLCEKCSTKMKRAIKAGHGTHIMAKDGSRRRDYAQRYGGKTKKSDSTMTPSESADAKAKAQMAEKKSTSSSDPYAAYRA